MAIICALLAICYIIWAYSGPSDPISRQGWSAESENVVGTINSVTYILTDSQVEAIPRNAKHAAPDRHDDGFVAFYKILEERWPWHFAVAIVVYRGEDLNAKSNTQFYDPTKIYAFYCWQRSFSILRDYK